MTPYDKLISRKRTWTPVQTEAGKLKEGAEEAVFRALALRCLELPVGDFISHSKFLAKNFWHSQSDSLFEKGIAEGFSSTKSARMPAFFEHSNVNLPQYA